MNWAEKIERLQNEQGFSTRSLELRAGLPVNSLAKDIRDRRNIGVDKGIRIARALNVAADWLFDDEQDWPPPASTPAPTANDPQFTAAVLRVISEAAATMADVLATAEGVEEPESLDDVQPQTELGKRLKNLAQRHTKDRKAQAKKKGSRRGA